MENGTDDKTGGRQPPKDGDWMARPGARPGTRGWFHRGRWLVERERFGLDAEAPDPPFHDAEELRDGLRTVLGRMGLQSANIQSILLSEWVQLVGVDVARHTRPGTVRNRELTVFVRGALWYSQLKRVGTAALQDRIVQRLGAESVNRVTLRPDPEGGTPS
jgi:hypothetical protein